MKRYDVYLTDRSYDVYLRNRLTVCDIIVHALTLRDSLSANAKILLDCCLAEYSIQKVLALKENRMEIAAHIDRMVKQSFEKLDLSSRVEFSAQLSAIQNISTDNAFYISADDLDIFPKLPVYGESSLYLGADPIRVFCNYLLNTSASMAVINISDVDSVDAVKYIDITDILAPRAELDEFVAKLITAGSNMKFSVEATISAGYYRTLLDLDGQTELNALSTYDNVSLGELEFVEK